MELLDHYAALARYNRWMNERLYGAAAELSDAERKRDLGAFFRSIHGTLNHLLLADRAWLARFTGDPEMATTATEAGDRVPFRSLDQELHADFGELRNARAETDAFVETWVATLTPGRLAGTLSYRDSKGNRHAHPLWWAVSHFFNHQTHHRGQVTALLTRLGHDPGGTDLILMLRQAAPSA